MSRIQPVRLPEPDQPLSGKEVIAILRERWSASYDLQLLQRNGRMYLQVMWAYLEQQTFPLSEADYRLGIERVVRAVNAMGQANMVRRWLRTSRDRPRVARALSLPLEPGTTASQSPH
ncbi:MAG: DUF3067 family protein [Aphanocapsa feldmannii 277cV]|uniref:DUF3067 family protein n=2 Tax=Aphanocapsa feldmannii TaxID=192050 RepID=A0A524RQR2_9CHRO|nr:MAG: DUF3067 family protein [Aphanocapsa feldmannii 277cV]